MSCYGSFGPISIGDCSAKSEVKVDTSSITKNISSSIQQSVSSVSSKTVAAQNLNFNVSNKALCCR